MYVILLKQVHFCFHATSSYEGAYHNDFEYGCNTVVVLAKGAAICGPI